VEIGWGLRLPAVHGSKVHDEITWNPARLQQGELTPYQRPSNHAGGLEGGMTNGEPLVVRVP